MPTLNWLLRTSRTGSASGLRTGLVHVYVVPCRSITRRCGESMKLDWYFVGPLVLILTATTSAVFSTLTAETCTAVSGICAVPMPAAASSSKPTIGTMGFIQRSPLPRMCIRMSVQSQAEGHRRGALARLRSHCKGHRRRRDARHSSVAEPITVPQDVADAVRSLDEGQGPLRRTHNTHQLGSAHVDAFALRRERNRHERIAAALGVVSHRRERGSGRWIERPHGRSSWRSGRRSGGSYRDGRFGRRRWRLGTATASEPG